MPASTEAPGTSTDSKSFLEFCAALIERKFSEGRLYDVEPSTIQRLILALKFTNPGKSRDAPVLIQEIEFICYAAIRYYKDRDYEPYMKRLLTIAKMIKRLLRMI